MGRSASTDTESPSERITPISRSVSDDLPDARRARDADRVGAAAVGRERRHRRAGCLLTGLDERQQARHAGAITASDALGEARGIGAGARQASSCPIVTAPSLVARAREYLLQYMRMAFSRNGMSDSREPIELADYRAELHAWLDAHHEELAPRYRPPGTLDDHVAQMQRVKSILFDAGWMQYGWPERVGGRGGSPMLRTELGAAIAARDLADPGLFSLIEVLAPTLIDFAPPELAAEVVPRLLSGAEMWCQGFSEPGSGSDLASLRCRAVPERRRPHGVDDG